MSIEQTKTEQLRKARVNPNSLYMELIQERGKFISQGIKFMFYFEGKEDFKYYNTRINNIFQDTGYTYRATEGKEAALKLEEMLRKNPIKDWKIKIIIDKDFDEVISNDRLYCLPCYSIENLYLEKECFKRILENEFGFTSSPFEVIDRNDYNKVLNLYSDKKNEFLNAIEDLNIWYSILKKRGLDLSELQNKKIFSEELLIFDLENSFRKQYTFESFKEIVKLSLEDIEISDEEYEEEKNRLNGNKSYNYRGKFNLEFFKKFLETLKEDSNKRTNRKYFSMRRKVVLELGNILGNFSQYANTPSCLKDCLENFLQENIN